MDLASRQRRVDELLRDRAWLKRLAAGMVRDRDLADDLSQETLAAALSTERIGALRPWLAGCVRNLARLHGRGEARRVARETAAARDIASGASPEEALGRAELQQRVTSAVLALDEPYRTTVLLRYLEEQPVAEVAARMGCPPSTVRVRTKRALARLYAELRSGEDTRGRGRLAALFALGREASPIAATVPSAPALLLGMKLTHTLLLMGLVVATATAVFLLETRAPVEVTGQDVGMAQADVALSGARLDAVTSDGTPSHAPIAAPEGTSSPSPPAAVARAPFPATGAGGPATELVGRVFGAENTPLAGALIELVDELQPRDDHAPFRTTRADDDGHFRLDELAPLTPFWLRISAPGHVAHASEEHPGDVGRIQLAGAVRLVGTVRAEDGTALAGAGVHAHAARGRARSRSATTAADGSYVIEGLPGGKGVQVAVCAERSLPIESSVRLSRSGETRHDVTLPPRGELAGIVVDYGTGAPVPHAELTSRFGHVVGRADAQGRFQIRALARALGQTRDQAIDVLGGDEVNGRYLGASLRAYAPGYCETSAPVWAPALDAGTEFALPLERSGRIVGIVRNADGTAAAGVVVTWHDAPLRFLSAGAMARTGHDSRGATTDQDGNFVLAEVPCAPDAGGTLQLRAGSVRVEYADACPRSPGETRVLELSLEERAGVYGQLLVNGVPEFGYVWVLDADGETGQSIETDDVGRFRVTGLADGAHRLQACTGDGTAVRSEVLDVTVPARDTVEIHIRARFDRITGRAVAPDGTPQAGVQILCIAQRERGKAGRGMILESSTDTASDGTYALRLDPDAEPERLFTVKAVRAGAVYEAIDVTGGSDDVDFVLPEAAPVRLTVRDAEGAPVAKVSVAWRLPSIGASAVFYSGLEMPTDDGVLELELPVGEVELELSAWSLGLGPRTTDVTVPPGAETTSIDVELR